MTGDRSTYLTGTWENDAASGPDYTIHFNCTNYRYEGGNGDMFNKSIEEKF